MGLTRFKREIALGAVYVALLATVATIAPSFYSIGNLRDLALNNAAILLVSLGMTLVIIAGEIDISVGSQFAVCSVVAGWLARAGVPMPLLLPCVVGVGAGMGALNGVLVGRLGLPSIIVTLAMFVAWRDALRWVTGGAWVQGLPANFQWFGLGRGAGEGLIVGVTLVVLLVGIWAMRRLAIARRVYAVGSDAEAARLVGLDPPRVVTTVFVIMGALVGLAALLNAVRFTTIPSNSGVGFELFAIAAVVVGGTTITGGRGTLIGTLIGTALLGTIGTTLTFVGISPFWEKAIQGVIILAAVCADVVIQRLTYHPTPRRAGAPLATADAR